MPQTLTPAQQQMARLLYGLAVGRGLPHQRAVEFAAAAFAESGLNPHATNSSSGAGGLFQLLSSGYRQKAQALGGVYNPRANALAILPDYQRYWRQHPGAQAGAAGRDVERSGMGAGFYAAPLTRLRGVGAGSGAQTAISPGGASGTPLANAYARPPAPQIPDFRPQLVSALMAQFQGGGSPNLQPLMGVLRRRRSAVENAQQQAAQRALQQETLSSATPQQPRSRPQTVAAGTEAPGMQGGKGGQTLGFLEPFAKQFGLQITSTTGGVHAPHSYHYQGRAVDFGGNPQRMAALARYAVAHPAQFAEVFYTGPGNPGFYVKNGHVYPNRLLDRGLYAEHTNHVHLAR